MGNEEWGPWIEHDGKGCPVVGQYIQCETDRDIHKMPDHVRLLKSRLVEYIPRKTDSASWIGKAGFAQVLRYRVRKPKGLTMLEQLLQNLPAPTKTKEMI